MGLDLFYYKASKNYGVTDVATERSEKVGDMRKCNPLYGHLRKHNIALEKRQQVVQLFKEDIRTIIEDSKRVLENHTLAPALMPTAADYPFWGNGLYNDEYFNEQIPCIIEESERALNEVDWDSENLYLVVWA